MANKMMALFTGYPHRRRDTAEAYDRSRRICTMET